MIIGTVPVLNATVYAVDPKKFYVIGEKVNLMFREEKHFSFITGSA